MFRFLIEKRRGLLAKEEHFEKQKKHRELESGRSSRVSDSSMCLQFTWFFRNDKKMCVYVRIGAQFHCNWNRNANSSIGIGILFLKIIRIGETVIFCTFQLLFQLHHETF